MNIFTTTHTWFISQCHLTSLPHTKALISFVWASCAWSLFRTACPDNSKDWCVLNMMLDCVWNVMAHAQKIDFVFRRNGRVHLNRRGRQFSRLQAAEVCPSALVMLGATCSEIVWRVLATHSIHQFLLHFPSRASPRVITFQLDSNAGSFGACFCL
jgi:hypothetical protein